MAERFLVEKVKQNSGDFSLIIIVVTLAGVGLATLFSSSYDYAERVFGDALFFLRKQSLFLGIGAVCFFLAYKVPLDFLKRIVPATLMVSLLLLLLTFVPGVGYELMGARRWLLIAGHSFQPSEFAKLALLLYLAYLFDKKQDRIDDMLNTVLPPLLVVAVFVMLVFLQNDFSSSVFILILSLSLFFMAGVRLIYFATIGTAVIPLTLIMLFTKAHRVERLIAFLRPDLDPAGSGYQVKASFSALQNGGLWGVGIGAGVKKMGGLPEVHSDFIFASLGEEVGFLGLFFVIALFFALAFRGYWIARQSRDLFSHLLAFGLTSAIVFQAIFNMCVVSGLVPATGIPLPFFSSGGTNMLVTMVMAGLLLNLSRQSAGSSGSLLNE